MKLSDRIDSADDGLSILSMGPSCARSSLSLPTDWPMQRSVTLLPLVDCTFMMEVMLSGAFGAQACHAANSLVAAACDNVQVTPNTSALFSGKTCSLNSVAMPKLPPPPPLQAQ